MRIGMKIKLIDVLATVAFSVCMFSCTIDDGDIVSVVELGAKQDEYLIGYAGGKQEVSILANCEFRIDSTEDWVKLDKSGGSTDCSFYISVDENYSFKRSAILIVSTELSARRDSIVIKQEGKIEASIEFEDNSIELNGAGQKYEALLNTNIPSSDINVDILYHGTFKDWLNSASVSGQESPCLTFEAVPNPDEVAPRTATLTMSFTDGWGDMVSKSIVVTQRNAKNELGRVVSFKELKAEYGFDERVSDYIILEGIVTSNKEGGNAGENEQTTTSAIDYDGTNRVAYIQSADGEDGVMIEALSPSDITFSQWDHVKLLLEGAVVMKKLNPLRYVISEYSSSMLIAKTPGKKEDVVVKEKSIADLTDADMYTYVTLSPVEFCIRKGSLTPVNEGYTNASASNRVNAFPTLLHDNAGGSAYLITNSTCIWRRDGRRLPSGSGKISGIIVHERFPRFSWKDGADPVDMESDDELGRIGTYLVRPQTEDDIFGYMGSNVEESFSAILTEYRFWNPDQNNKVLLPTYGTNGYLTHTFKGTTGDYGQPFRQRNSYSYLGKVGSKATYMHGINKGNVTGCGIVLDPEKEHYLPAMASFVGTNSDGSIEWCGLASVNSVSVSINSDGKGATGNAYQVWQAYSSWDTEKSRPYAFLISCSTSEIVTDHIWMQFSMLNGAYKCPRYWKAEWSESDSMEAEDDRAWKMIGKFVVPDLSQNSPTLFFTTSGFKYFCLELPKDLLGKDEVFIRLIPENDLCSSGTGYADAHLSALTQSSTATTMEYFAIRYNK